jgi:S-adenosyl methyltransferase
MTHTLNGELSPDRANACRMYDYLIGGTNHTVVDGPALDKLLTVAPTTPTVARENRAFMRRAVRYLAAEAGIDQFLDLGSGIPTPGDQNLHQIVAAINPAVRVVYVDREQVAVDQYRDRFGADSRVVAVRGDVQGWRAVLGDPAVRQMIDFRRPVALVATGVFPFVPDDDDPVAILAAYRDACAPGSYLALSHALTAEHWPGDLARRVLDIYRDDVQEMYPRTIEQVTALFSGYRMVEPGLVSTPAWHPEEPLTDDQKAYVRAAAGIGILDRPAARTLPERPAVEQPAGAPAAPRPAVAPPPRTEVMATALASALLAGLGAALGARLGRRR